MRICFKDKDSVCFDSKGFTMIYIIVGMIALSTISAGLYTMTGSVSMNMAKRVPHDQVILQAQSGLNYAAAVAELVDSDDDVDDEDKASTFKAALEAETYPITIGAGQVVLSAGGVIDDSVVVTSTATSGKLTFSLATNFDYSLSLGSSIYALSATSELALDNQNFVDGTVYGKKVILANQSEVTGDVVSKGDVTLINQSEVGGGICASGNVELQNQTSVAKDINAFGNVTLGADTSTVSGNIYAVGNVVLENGAVVQGDIHAGGNVVLGSNNSHVYGSVFADGNVLIEHNAIVGKDVNAGGNLDLTTRGTIQGNVVVGGGIKLADKSVINGDATAGGSIDLAKKTSIDGKSSSNVANPNPIEPTPPTICLQICMPDHALFSCGSENVNVSWNKDKSIAPGKYNNLNLGGKNKIYLSSGDYYFSQINTGTEPSLYLDLSSGDINIFVCGDVYFGDSLDIYVKSEGSYESIVQGNKLKEDLRPLAAKVYIETLGKFTMSNQNEWFGTIYAKGDITFKNQNLLVGSYHSSNGKVTPANQMDVYFVQSNYAQDNWEYSCD